MLISVAIARRILASDLGSTVPGSKARPPDSSASLLSSNFF